MIVRLLQPADASSYATLRREMLGDAPLAFSASPEDDFARDVAALAASLGRGPEWVIVGAFEGEALVGAAGLMRERHLKARHKMSLWGMYVSPRHRGSGIAAAILAEAARHARSLPGIASIRLSVNSSAPGARRVYERAGFVEWGAEPDALRYGGQSTFEHHMLLDLERNPPTGE